MTLFSLDRKQLILTDAKERILKKNTLGVGYLPTEDKKYANNAQRTTRKR